MIMRATCSVSSRVGEVSRFRRIKDYVIVTIVYLKTFYGEKGQMIGYILIIQ